MPELSLDPRTDYGFTVDGVTSSRRLPRWDVFRLEVIGEIFETSVRMIDFGDGSRGLSDLFSGRLEGKLKLSVDIDPGEARHVVADICHLPFRTGSFDGIVCAGILGNVYNPLLATDEVHRVAKTGAKVFAYVSWIFPYSGVPGQYRDYYHFSEDGVRHLFRNFSSVVVAPVRGRLETILNLLPGLGKRSALIRLVGPVLRRFDVEHPAVASGFNVLVTK